MENAVVILPTYNEVKNIGIVLPRIFEQGDKLPTHTLHVVVVDDNSPDGTQDVVKHHMDKYSNLHLVTGEKRGLGEAYKRGISYALSRLEPDVIFEMDADLQHDPDLIPLFVTLSQYGFNTVIGSRFALGGLTKKFSIYRKFLSIFGNWLLRVLGGLPHIHDCTSGYRCIKADLIRKCNLSSLSTRGYSFQSSLLYELVRNNARIIEIPIVFEERAHGQSKLSFRDKIEFLLNIGKIRLRKSNELIKFCFVGFTGIFVNMGLYVFLTRLASLQIEIASPIAIELSILWNFWWNDIWTFHGRHGIAPRLTRALRFHAVAGIAGLTNYVVLLLLTKVFGLWDVGSNLVGIAIGAAVNYLINSFWTWRDEGNTHQAWDQKARESQMT